MAQQPHRHNHGSSRSPWRQRRSRSDGAKIFDPKSWRPPPVGCRDKATCLPLKRELTGRFGCFQKLGVPQNGWFIVENPIKMDDLGVPLFSEASICITRQKKPNGMKNHQLPFFRWFYRAFYVIAGYYITELMGLSDLEDEFPASIMNIVGVLTIHVWYMVYLHILRLHVGWCFMAIPSFDGENWWKNGMKPPTRKNFEKLGKVSGWREQLRW